MTIQNELWTILIVKVIYLISLWADAKSDAVIDNKEGRNHGLEVLQHIHLGAAILLWFVDFNMMLWTVASYLIMRAGLFNPVYNHYRNGIGFNHLGDNLFDNLLRPILKFEKKNRFPALFIAYMIVAFFGLIMGFIKI